MNITYCTVTEFTATYVAMYVDTYIAFLYDKLSFIACFCLHKRFLIKMCVATYVAMHVNWLYVAIVKI